jgi:hypothetical protein
MTTTPLRLLRIALLVAAGCIPSASVYAQIPTVPPAMRDAALAAVQREFAGQLASATTDAAKEAVYRQMFEALIRNESLYQKLTPQQLKQIIVNDSSVATKSIVDVGRNIRESAIAPSTSAPLSNPTSTQLVERSASTELLALAADLKQLFSADGSAVTLNLNALGLFRGSQTKEVNAGAQYLYFQREQLRRLTGSVTFGAKIPEKELTGITAIPDPDKLFDAIAWDVKFRAYGDRDPRASRWHELFIDRLGTVTELAATVPTHAIVPLSDTRFALTAASEVLGNELRAAANRVSNSLLVSVKFSGQHLTQETGRNKYLVGTMVDKGFADLDFTANATFSAADAPAMNATDPFRTKDWQVAAALTGSVLKDALVKGRAAELSASLSGIVPMDDAGVPVDRKRIVKVNTTLTLPFMDKAKIPLSFTYSNDPNNLTKEKYVTGQIGVSYDFGAIWDLFK